MNLTMPKRALLAIALIVAVAPDALAQPKGGSAGERATTTPVLAADKHRNVRRSTDKPHSGGSDWEPCDYHTCARCG